MKNVDFAWGGHLFAFVLGGFVFFGFLFVFGFVLYFGKECGYVI
jgi:hypothetical protein